MTKLFNVDVDNTITSFKLSHENENNNFYNQLKQLKEDCLKLYAQKYEENLNISKQLSDINIKINEDRDQLRCVAEKINSDQVILKTENDRLESIHDNLRLLKIEENEVNDMINKCQTEVTQVVKEKKGLVKKIKREINSFKSGVNLYEQFLQLNMEIAEQENNDIIKIDIRSKNHSAYKVILEESENDFKLKDIIPRNQPAVKAAKLYTKNNDIQGLLAFLYKTNKK